MKKLKKIVLWLKYRLLNYLIKNDDSYLVYIDKWEDDTLAFTWYGKDCRTSLFIHKDINESSWHYVSKRIVGGEMCCDKLSEMNVDNFIKSIKKTKENM